MTARHNPATGRRVLRVRRRGRPLLIHTGHLCGANSFDYLIELQRHARNWPPTRTSGCRGTIAKLWSGPLEYPNPHTKTTTLQTEMPAGEMLAVAEGAGWHRNANLWRRLRKLLSRSGPWR